jgi:hypothetical protein
MPRAKRTGNASTGLLPSLSLLMSCVPYFLAVAAIGVLLCSCAYNLHPYTSSHLPGQARRLELLQDEVQSGVLWSETAPAGTYVAALENDDYIFYVGSGIIVQKKFVKTVARGGIAVSKKHPSVAVLFTQDPLGTNLRFRIHAPLRFRP